MWCGLSSTVPFVCLCAMHTIRTIWFVAHMCRSQARPERTIPKFKGGFGIEVDVSVSCVFVCTFLCPYTRCGIWNEVGGERVLDYVVSVR